MNIQELSESLKLPTGELSEVFKLFGIDPSQSLAEMMSGEKTEVYIRRLKKIAVDERLTLIQAATKVKEAVEGFRNQKVSDSNGVSANNASGFNGVNGLAYMEQYFLALTKGQWPDRPIAPG